MSGKSHILNKSYRNTRQIARSAYSLIQDDENITGDENYVIPSAIDKQGADPVFRRHENEKEEARYVCARIKELAAGSYSHNDIAVIARLHQQLDYLQGYLVDAGIPCYRSRRKGDAIDDHAVRLLTLHAIKGLEFTVVFIIGLNERVMPFIPGPVAHEDSKLIESNERKLLYVGMTRATEMLYLSSSGKPSPFIAGIDALLRLSYQAKIKGFYRVNPDDYLFRDRLHSSWSSEEKVRQWMLKELSLIHISTNPLAEYTATPAGIKRNLSLAQMLDSLQQLTEMEINLIFPGHGHRIEEPRELINSRIAFYRQRLEEIYNLLKSTGPQNPYQLALAHFKGRLKGFDIILAVNETLVNLDLLVHQGRAFEEQSDGVAVFGVN